MKRKFRIGDEVIYINKKFSDDWEEAQGYSLHDKIVKIKAIEKFNWSYYSYLLDFKDDVSIWCREESFRLKKRVKTKRKLKIGDLVIYIDKKESDKWEKVNKGSLYGKVARIVQTDESGFCFLEFKEPINGNDGHCKWCEKNQFKLKKPSNQKIKIICTVKIKKGDEIIYKKEDKKRYR